MTDYIAFCGLDCEQRSKSKSGQRVVRAQWCRNNTRHDQLRRLQAYGGEVPILPVHVRDQTVRTGKKS